MGKRQVRIFQKDLATHAPELLKQAAVQVVLCNKSVVTGCVSSINSGMIALRDFRAGKHQFPFSSIEEIIYDFETPH